MDRLFAFTNCWPRGISAFDVGQIAVTAAAEDGVWYAAQNRYEAMVTIDCDGQHIRLIAVWLPRATI
jgi:hypothetical protein